MIEKKYEKLKSQTIDITKSILNLIQDVDNVMNCDNKDFVVTYKNKIYDIHPATDVKEFKDQTLLRRKLSILMTERCLKILIAKLKKNKDLDFSDTWDDVLCFTMGEDPADHQFEKFIEESVYEVDGTGEKITSIPLNIDSYAVKNDLGLLDGELSNVEQVEIVDTN